MEYFRTKITLKRSVINSATSIPTPSASDYTKTQVDALIAANASAGGVDTSLNSWADLGALSTFGSGPDAEVEFEENVQQLRAKVAELLKE